MVLSRLDADTKGIDVTIKVNEKLRPYFTMWYQRKKKDGETPAEFALRVLKTTALNDYISEKAQTESNKIEETKNTAIQDLQTDITMLNREVD